MVSIEGEPAHVPVLLEAALDGLAVTPGGVFVDATFGRGGHARAIAAAASGVRVVALDVDRAATEAAAIPGVELLHANFRELARVLDDLGLGLVDGVLFDFGVSSPQFDVPERGFSFAADGPLDMRLDRETELRAFDILRETPERELADIFFNLGEERGARRIARAVVEARARGEVRDSTLWFAGLVARSLGGRRGRIHPATRAFQALRMAVNDELGAIEAGLEAATLRTKPGGRIAAISFHSLEDRIVKTRFRSDARVRPLTKKPVVAARDEIARNRRSRSAKLRVAERVADAAL